MLRHQPDHLMTDVIAVHGVNIQTVQERMRRFDAGLLVVARADPPVDERRRGRLAEVVTDGAEHDRDLLRSLEIVDPRPRLIDDQQRVHPHIALGMPLWFLLAADQRFQLGEQLVDDTERERQLEPA